MARLLLKVWHTPKSDLYYRANMYISSKKHVQTKCTVEHKATTTSTLVQKRGPQIGQQVRVYLNKVIIFCIHVI